MELHVYLGQGNLYTFSLTPGSVQAPRPVATGAAILFSLGPLCLNNEA